jgi:hypothetical protein
MSAFVFVVQGDKRTEARRLLEKLVADGTITGKLPDVDLQDDSTVAVIDPEHEGVIPDFEALGFKRQQDEDSH